LCRRGESFDSFERQFPSVESIACGKTVRSFHVCAGDGAVMVVVVVMFRNLEIFGHLQISKSEGTRRQIAISSGIPSRKFYLA
jgi:hypothetical protein